MRSQERYTTKIKFPDSMPTFSSDNPIQALYLKKKGVERLLTRNIGITVSSDFAKETKKKIEMESMLIDRRRCGSRKNDREDKDVLHGILETKLSFDEDDEKRQLLVVVVEEESKCEEIACYDSDDESEWSLPGVEHRATDIRYVFGDDDYVDSARQERRIDLYEKEQREGAKSINAMELFSKYLTCHLENNFKINDWVQCIRQNTTE